MADNTTLPGTGDVIATDDIGGVKYQIVKQAFGALDTATLVTPTVGLPVAPVTAAYQSVVTVTRAANTTAYAAGDIVGGAITFASIGPGSGSVMRITSVNAEYNVATVPSGMTTMRLYLYSATPPSAVADNGVFDVPSGDRASYVGFIDLGALQDVGSTLILSASNINLPVKLAGTSLYGYLVTASGFTPAANSETLRLTLNAEVI